MWNMMLILLTLLPAVYAFDDGGPPPIDVLIDPRNDDSSNNGPLGAFANRAATMKAMKFMQSAGILGVGYNLIRASPQVTKLGTIQTYGASDTGVTMARIFESNRNPNKSGGYFVPDHVVYREPRNEGLCRKDLNWEIIPGLKAYQRLLLANTVKAVGDDYKECKKTQLGEQYQGTMNVSAKGLPCQMWNSSMETKMPSSMSLNHNYCRNPSKFWLGPWCFVNSSFLQNCAVDFCKPSFPGSLVQGAFMEPYMIDSGSYAKIKKSIFFETKEVCPEGSLELQINEESRPQVADTFMMAVCNLPEDAEEKAYMNFIDTFGTHVAVGADVGAVHLKHYELKREDVGDLFLKYFRHEGKIKTIKNPETKTEEQYITFQFNMMNREIIKVELVEFNDDAYVKNFEWRSGTRDIPSPYSLTLLQLDEVLDPVYWKKCEKNDTAFSDCCASLHWRQSNLVFALSRYAEYKGVVKSEELFDEDTLAIRLEWPEGYYSLPAVANDCPADDWHRGTVTHGTFKNNQMSKHNHLAATKGYKKITHAFCTKDVKDKRGRPWPEGSYCIHRMGHTCPPGFKGGFIWWDDSHSQKANVYKGVVPDGDYGPDKDLRLEYCCRNDGPTSKPIVLPTARPFYLMMIADRCQNVWRMNVKKEWIFWDSNDFCVGCPRHWQNGGLHPRNDNYYENNKLYYCYYEPEDWDPSKSRKQSKFLD